MDDAMRDPMRGAMWGALRRAFERGLSLQITRKMSSRVAGHEPGAFGEVLCSGPTVPMSSTSARRLDRSATAENGDSPTEREDARYSPHFPLAFPWLGLRAGMRCRFPPALDRACFLSRICHGNAGRRRCAATFPPPDRAGLFLMAKSSVKGRFE